MHKITADSASPAMAPALGEESSTTPATELALDELDSVVGGLERTMMPPKGVWSALGAPAAYATRDF